MLNPNINTIHEIIRVMDELHDHLEKVKDKDENDLRYLYQARIKKSLGNLAYTLESCTEKLITGRS